MTYKKYNVAAVQVSLNAGPEENLAKCTSWVEKAAALGAQVVCLPELYSSFYFCQSENTDYFELAEPLGGVSHSAFSALAKSSV